jgi:hypothetical protein
VDQSPTPASPSAASKTRRWSRWLGRSIVAVALVMLCVTLVLQDQIRTLRSLRRIPGTKAYVMDYYVDYHINDVRAHGIDVNHVEDSVMGVLFPKWTLPIATRLKSRFLTERIETIETGDHCSTVMLHPHDGDVFFGRNLDYKHDACLILKVHGRKNASSVAVLDLHYLNLDRDDLDQLNLIRRIPLLFAPYYLQDGMNEDGVAVADMSVSGVRTPYEPGKPSIIHSLAMRLILDYARNTDEAIALLKEYNIHFVAETCHLMIADATGKSAVVEFIDGELKPTTSGENWQVCTNHQLCGKDESQNDACCTRYHTASDKLAALHGSATAGDVMNVMETVKQPHTMWSSVYDLSSGEFEFAYRQHFDKLYRDRIE